MERKQFGAPLAAFQINQEKLVRMLGNIQAMLLVGWRLCKLYESGKMTPGHASLGKVRAPIQHQSIPPLRASPSLFWFQLPRGPGLDFPEGEGDGLSGARASRGERDSGRFPGGQGLGRISPPSFPTSGSCVLAESGALCRRPSAIWSRFSPTKAPMTSTAWSPAGRSPASPASSLLFWGRAGCEEERRTAVNDVLGKSSLRPWSTLRGQLLCRWIDSVPFSLF